MYVDQTLYLIFDWNTGWMSLLEHWSDQFKPKAWNKHKLRNIRKISEGLKHTARHKASAAWSTCTNSSSAWILFTRPFQEDSISSKNPSGMISKELIFWSFSLPKEITSPILWEIKSHSFTWKHICTVEIAHKLFFLYILLKWQLLFFNYLIYLTVSCVYKIISQTSFFVCLFRCSIAKFLELIIKLIGQGSSLYHLAHSSAQSCLRKRGLC